MHKTKGLGPLAIIIILAILLGGGYVVYRNYQQPTTDNQQKVGSVLEPKTPNDTVSGFESQAECEQKTRHSCHFECGGSMVKGKGYTAGSCDFAKWVVSSGEDTSDWKTYRNEKYGFDFLYPANATLKNESILIPFMKAPNDNADKSLEISVSENLSECSDVTSAVSEQRNVNGIPFTVYKWENFGGTQSWSSLQRYNTVKDNMCYKLWARIAGQRYGDACGRGDAGADCAPIKPNYDFNEETKVFDQIISTFKFTK